MKTLSVFKVIFLLSITKFSFAQEKITDFFNPQQTFPNRISYKSIVNNKVVFTAYTPETGSELWTTDGTKEGTKLITDLAEGGSSTFFNKFVRFQNWLYFDNGWKTNGNVIIKNDSLKDIVGVIDEKPLLQKVLSKPNYIYPFTPFTTYKLLVVNKLNDTLSLSNQPILSFTQIDNAIFFNTFSHNDSTWTFSRYREGKVEQIHSEKIRQMAERMDFYTYNGYLYFRIYLTAIDYDSRSGNKSMQSIIRVEDDLSKGYQIKKFDGNLSFYKNEQEQKMYLFHQINNSLQLFELGNPATMKLKNQVKIEPINYAGGYFSISYNADKISYIKATGTFSENDYLYLFEHNLVDNTVRQSENLIKIFSKALSNYEVKFLKENQYEISSNPNLGELKKLGVYDLAKNEWKDLPITLKTDTILLQNKRIVLSDTTVGVLNNTDIDELLTKSEYFLNYNSIHHSTRFKDKLLFFIKPLYKNYLELWLSNGEKGGNEFLATIKGEYFHEAFELNNQLFIITYTSSYSSGMYQFFKTNGTEEGTKLIFSTNENDRASLSQSYKNEKQVVYQIQESNATSLPSYYFLIFEEGNIKKIDASKFDKIASLYQTNSQTFFRTYEPNSSANSLYLIDDSAFRLVSSNVSDVFSHQNRLYFIKDFQSFYFENNKVTLVSDDYIFNQQILGNKLIVIQKNTLSKTETTYTFIINDLMTNKEDIRFEQSFPKDLANYRVFQIKNVIIVASAGKLIIVEGNQKFAVQLPSQYVSEIKPFDNGFLVDSYPILAYYDLDDNSLTTLSTNGNRKIDSMGNKLLIIENPNNDNQRQFQVFDTATKKIYIQPQNLLYFTSIGENGIIDRGNKKSYYWVFENEQFVKKYEFDYPENGTLNLVSVDNHYYIPYYKASTGFELAEIGSDSLLYFPEIVNGSEGITLNRVFHFNNQVYIIAFTNTHGTQVWRMGAIKAEQKAIVAEEIKAESLVKVYPNPTTDLVSIESSQPFQLSLINSNGVLIKQMYLEDKQTFDLKNLPTGLYLLRFENKNQAFSKKIVKF